MEATIYTNIEMLPVFVCATASIFQDNREKIKARVYLTIGRGGVRRNRNFKAKENTVKTIAEVRAVGEVQVVPAGNT